MTKNVFLAGAAIAVLATSTAIGVTPHAAALHRNGTATAAQARAFVAKAETELAAESLYVSHAAWVQATYINSDTNWLVARANAENTDLAVGLAKDAARFDHVTVDDVTRRKLYLLKQELVLPASSRPGASQELSDIRARLNSAYSTAKFTYNGKSLTLDDMEDILRTSRDPNETRVLWEGWRSVSSPQMKGDYTKLVMLANEGSRELGYADTGALWRSWYDMPADAFAAKTDVLWHQVEPLYNKLHCYVRAKLNAKYGDSVQPKTGLIRADLTGNMWGQDWGNINDIVQPAGGPGLGYDLTASLVSHGYDPVKMVHVADNWYQSIGFAPEPATFWERSQITRPRDRDVICHASAWDVDAKNDIRLKACITVTADDFYTVHHELGHNMYQRAYNDQPYLFQGGANDGFHEAIGDFAGLNALTPDYLKRLGLIDTVPGADADLPYLLKMALSKIAILPFALIVDKWRWGVFSGAITPEHYNDAWWDLVEKYQGLTPPGPRPANAFDPGAKFHVANNTPYTRYFLAEIYEFQFYRAACRLAGWRGPLNRCNIFGNKDVGAKFNAMLEMGRSKPWPEELATFTGEHDIDASAINDYFAPLSAWLDKQNEGQACTR
ncbi:MAG TPA: M2 family metallopeptidase [Rhizomicrobium sp.]|jgi:peptidyl-dipeptidase A|nr:M2 family metallopeptidase [Rhizomicrobium sp.]